MDAVRSLGAQIARAAEKLDYGYAPSSIEMSDIDDRLTKVRASIAPGTDEATARKFIAIAMRFERLKYDIAHTTRGAVLPARRAEVDVETASASHGASCTNAMGITLDRPIRLTLPHSSDAWFFIPATDARNLRFHTLSAGPDPMLEIVGGCGAGAESIATNDDSLGLDADVAAFRVQQQTLYVHLTNSGSSGSIELLAAAAPETVNGTVKDVKTNAPIQGAQIALYASSNPYFSEGYGYTDQNGNYSAFASQPGTYYVMANAQSYVTQLYPTGYCQYGNYYLNQECDLSTAQTVTVTANGSVSNINFSLSMGQKISGQVRATDNTPLIASSVSLLMPNGQSIAYVNTDTAGHFVFSTLPPGSYVIEAAAQGYGSQLYDNVPCAGTGQTQCNALAANPVNVSTQDVADINFRLPHLSSFFGTITGSDGQPLPSVGVTVLDESGNAIGYGNTDNAGHYSAGSLSAGTYYLFASGYAVFPRLYPNHDCVSSCSSELSDGTSFTFASGQDVEADFVMDYLPTLSGHITDATTGAPLRNVQVLLNTQPPSVSGYSSLSASTDALGNYDVPYIPAGTYFVWAQSNDHVDQIYSGVVCESINFYSTVNCNVTGATLLTVTAGEQTVPSFDFALNASSSISGHATIRAGAGSDIPAPMVTTIYDGTGATIASASSDANGNYIITDLAPGSYFAVATLNYYDAISQIWQGIDCTTCVATTGTPIVLAAGTSADSVDFQLTRIDAVVGRVVDNDGNPLSGIVIDLFSAIDKSYVSGAGTDRNGFYVVSAPIAASYYAATEAGGGYTDQVYSGIPCPNGTAYDRKCSLVGATMINMSGSATQPHIVNFTLTSNDRIFESGFD